MFGGLTGLITGGAGAGLLGDAIGGLFGGSSQSGESSRTETGSRDQYSTGFSDQQSGPGDFTAPAFNDVFLPTLLQAFSDIGISPFSGPLVAGADPLQVAANEASLGLAADNVGQGGGVRDLANELISGSTLNPMTSPGFAQMLQAATRPAIQAFGEQVVPQITSNAIASGAFGGSRNGVALGLASDRLGENLADTGSQLAYSNAQAERTRQLQSAPQLLQSAFALDAAPLNLAMQLGNQRQDFTQDQITENAQLDQMARSQPFAQLGQFGQLLNLIGNQRQVGTTESAQNSASIGTSTGTFMQEQDPGAFGNLQNLVNAGALGQYGLSDPGGSDPLGFLFGG